MGHRLKASPEQITRIASSIVDGLGKLDVLDGATALILALSVVLMGKRDGTTVEEVAEITKQSLIDEMRRLDARARDRGPST